MAKRANTKLQPTEFGGGDPGREAQAYRDRILGPGIDGRAERGIEDAHRERFRTNETGVYVLGTRAEFEVDPDDVVTDYGQRVDG